MRVRIALASCALLLAPAAARALEESEGAAALAPDALKAFDSYDKDADGKLSRAEFAFDDVFDALDGDRNGFLTKEEIKAFLAKAAPAKDKEPGKEKGKGEAGKAPGDAKAPPRKRREGVDPRKDPEARARDILANFDRDKDGKIARAEFPGDEGDGVFRKFDRDKDGSLAQAEVLALAKDQLEDLKKARQRPKRGEFLYLFDDDMDNRVTKEEYDGPARAFAEYDVNDDGVVTYDELIYPNRYRRNGDRKQASADGGAESQNVWDLYDKDKDGRVTKEEWGGAEAVFRRLDRNGDGVLTLLDA